MKLVLKNYGAVKDCTIDLSKKLYVFMGYNNTGKTYLTKLIYEIFNKQTLDSFSYSNYNKFKENINNLKLTDTLINSILENFATYLKEVVIQKSFKIEITESFKIHFEYDIENIRISGLESSAEIEIKEKKIEVYRLIKEKNTLQVNIKQSEVDDMIAKLPKNFFDDVPKQHFTKQIRSVKEDASIVLINSLLNLLFQNKEQAFFLPSNRISLLENAEEIKKYDVTRKEKMLGILLELAENPPENTKQKLNKERLIEKSKGEYSFYIIKLIDDILKLRSNKDEEFLIQGTGFYTPLLTQFISLLGGEIIYEKVASFANSFEKFKLHQTTTLPMDLASSSINQLSLLFLYLKYWAKSKQNFLMIDEPEQNLHPENQILLMNLLLEFLFFANNRLLVTTHSPLIAEIINNYLILSQLENKEEIAKKFGLLNIDLSPQNTAIYYFNGETVQKHQIGEYGSLFTAFKLAQDKIYGLSAELSDLMFVQLNKDDHYVSNE